MSKKVVKSVLSWILVLAMVMTLVPVAPEYVSAAAKVSLSTTKVTITEGMTQTLKLKNVLKGSESKHSGTAKS